MRSWGWSVQYGSALLLALLLGVILGHIPLFKETALGSTKLTASQVAQFLGYGGALVMFWMMGQRAAAELPRDGASPSFLGQVIPPLTTLVVLAAGHQVVLLLLAPFLGKTGKGLYNWIFVAGMVGAALWLSVAWFRSSEALAPMLESRRRSKRADQGPENMACPRCGEGGIPGQKYCPACGQKMSLDVTRPKVV